MPSPEWGGADLTTARYRAGLRALRSANTLLATARMELSAARYPGATGTITGLRDQVNTLIREVDAALARR